MFGFFLFIYIFLLVGLVLSSIFPFHSLTSRDFFQDINTYSQTKAHLVYSSRNISENTAYREHSLQSSYGQIIKVGEVELLSASEVFVKAEVYITSRTKPLKI